MAKGKRERAEVEHYASDDGFVEDAPKSKKTKATNTKSNGEGGTSVFPLDTEFKQVSVGPYQGKNYVNIREYYKDKASGDMKPGKKGIALNVASFNSLLATLPAIRQALIDSGEDVDDIPTGLGNLEEGKLNEGRMVEGKVEKVTKERKSNIEDTSDDEG